MGKTHVLGGNSIQRGWAGELEFCSRLTAGRGSIGKISNKYSSHCFVILKEEKKMIRKVRLFQIVEYIIHIDII